MKRHRQTKAQQEAAFILANPAAFQQPKQQATRAATRARAAAIANQRVQTEAHFPFENPQPAVYRNQKGNHDHD